MRKCCDMRGFLSFLVLRLILKNNCSGEELRQELLRRKGHKPSPGTIYPVLKALSEAGFIEETKESGKEKRYRVTPRGKKEVEVATQKFIALFCDMKEDFGKQ